MKMKFTEMSGVVKVLLMCLCVTVLIFIGSFFYYANINSSEDPRTLPAKELLLQYEKQLEEEQTSEAHDLLNRMLQIYLALPGYENSYEVGVIYNNIASVYLVQLETEILTNKDLKKEDLVMNLGLASKFTQKAIVNYEQWLKEMGTLSEQEIKTKITPFFDPKDPSFKDTDFDSIVKKRIDDIMIAQLETKRRLSVALTNKGVVDRYSGNLEQAKESYTKAINLWDRNYTAQDNLNVLMNQPVQKRSMIDRLFPPDKNKEKSKRIPL